MGDFNSKMSKTLMNSFCNLYNLKCLVKKQLAIKILSIHLAIFKIKIGISPIIMTKIFKFCDNATHNLRSGQVLERGHNRANNFRVE